MLFKNAEEIIRFMDLLVHAVPIESHPDYIIVTKEDLGMLRNHKNYNLCNGYLTAGGKFVRFRLKEEIIIENIENKISDLTTRLSNIEAKTIIKGGINA